MTKNDSQDMRTPPPISSNDGSAFPEVNLNFLARLTFHSSKRYRTNLSKTSHIPPNTVVLGAEAVLVNKVLIDALSRQADFKLG